MLFLLLLPSSSLLEGKVVGLYLWRGEQQSVFSVSGGTRNTWQQGFAVEFWLAGKRE